MGGWGACFCVVAVDVTRKTWTSSFVCFFVSFVLYFREVRGTMVILPPHGYIKPSYELQQLLFRRGFLLRWLGAGGGGGGGGGWVATETNMLNQNYTPRSNCWNENSSLTCPGPALGSEKVLLFERGFFYHAPPSLHSPPPPPTPTPTPCHPHSPPPPPPSLHSHVLHLNLLRRGEVFKRKTNFLILFPAIIFFGVSCT